ncbi:MAG: hypothetical protein OEM41_08915 [Ignavibacteria bacterium]|nr:hypothetical protein [Ignavibacteria bacterium]
MKSATFWVFGTLQSISLGFIVFILFRSMNQIHGVPVIGWDAQLALSITFPLFLLLVEYAIFAQRK